MTFPFAPSAPATALAAALLAGCADPDLELAQAARTSLLGMGKADLLGCAGVPDRSAPAEGGRESLTYLSRGLESVPRPESVIVDGEDARGRPTLRREWVTVFDARERRCEATFTLRDGAVERLAYGEGWSPGRCAAIVANCVAPPP